ncbi:MAG: acetolactate synthase [Candidatus Marinimicrobia bacterium]|nr:acetolactate synthase [Candidatus Neomarinimicrobiota bacterium]MEC7934867.1 thiamine pyrophosphate-binding protein [Candidatus Neomarinimicrobiota bacterium]|tara:strand:+ start:2076 stop:3791 length:1716 start_codon:yes stop_codon:yes gene_type:complete
MKHGGDIVASTLKQHNIKHIFTLCGGHISPILVSCSQNDIKVIDVRHEATAVFAADAISRLSPAIGVAAVTAGPGLTNTVTAVKNLQMAQVPVLLLVGATATVLKNRGSLQDIDQIGLMRSLTKYQAVVNKGKDIANQINKAIIIAQSDVPGPVFIELPLDLLYPKDMVYDLYGLNQKMSWFVKYYLQRNFNKIFNDFDKKPLPVPKINYSNISSNKLSKCLEMILKAKKPLLLIGSQLMINVLNIEKISKQLSLMNMPIFVSGMARGLMSNKDIEIFRHKRTLALNECDLVILAGVPCDFRLGYGRQINKDAKIIAINRDRKDLYLNIKPSLAIQSDPGSFISKISEKVSENKLNYSVWLDNLRSREKDRENEIEKQSKIKTDYVNPIQLFRIINKHIDKNDIIVADGGDFVATASYILRPRFQLGWLDPGPFGTLGVGAGFILGSNFACPNSTIWGIYGDGAFGYSMAEFDTFSRHNIPVIAIIGNDGGWTQIARDQVEIFNDPVATELGYSNYHEVIDKLGGIGYEISENDDIHDVIVEAKEHAKSGNSVLINVKIGKTDFRKGSISV